MSSYLTEATSGVGAPVEENPALMPSVRTSRHCWAVVLAGGDGTRLQSLTLKIAGDARPKQFCSLFGGESLLTQTRARLESLFGVDRQMFVVTRARETGNGGRIRAAVRNELFGPVRAHDGFAAGANQSAVAESNHRFKQRGQYGSEENQFRRLAVGTLLRALESVLPIEAGGLDVRA